MSSHELLSQADVADAIGDDFFHVPTPRLVLGLARCQTLEKYQSDFHPDDQVGGNGNRVYHPMLVV